MIKSIQLTKAVLVGIVCLLAEVHDTCDRGCLSSKLVGISIFNGVLRIANGILRLVVCIDASEETSINWRLTKETTYKSQDSRENDEAVKQAKYDDP